MQKRTPISFCNGALLAALLSSATLSSSWAQTKKPAAKPGATPAAAKPKPKPKPAVKPAVKATPKPTPLQVQTPAPTPIAEAGPKTYALLVGVSTYQNPSINKLNYPATDAKGLQEALTDPKLGNIPKDQVLLLTDEQATRDNILNSVDTFFKPKVQEGDRVMVFLAGHGVSKGVGIDAKSYLLPNDVKGLTKDSFDSSAVDLKVLSDKLAELPANEYMMFIDACREDPTPGRGIKGNTLTDIMARSVQVSPPNRQVESATFFACSLGQRAYEDPRLKHGVFTYWILQGLNSDNLPRPDGVIDMGRLAHFVTNKVQTWAKEVSQTGDFDVEQTPEIVTGEIQNGVQVIKVRNVSGTTDEEAVPTKLAVVTTPAGAQVSINGKRVGVSPVMETFKGGGEFQVKVEMPGYSSEPKTVKLLDGYGHQIRIPLVAERGVNDDAAATFGKAQRAEAQGDFTTALAGYTSAMQSGFVPAFERVASLQINRNQYADAITTLAQLTKQAPSVHSWSLLSRTYAAYAMQLKAQEAATPAQEEPKGKGKGKAKAPAKPKYDLSTFRVPQSGDESAQFAREAAGRALGMGGNTVEANATAGFASVASDNGAGGNKNESLGYFNKAVQLDSEDATAQYGLGYALRFFTKFAPEGTSRADLERARTALQKAVELRPTFFEAQRELGFCAQMLNDNEAALKHYQVASSMRSSTNDPNEIAGVEVAMSSVHKEEAEKATDPEKKKRHQEASEGYMAEAKDTSPDLLNNKVFWSMLSYSGLGSKISRVAPLSMVSTLMSGGKIEDVVKDIAEQKAKDKIREKIKLPFGF
jgi:tetratricopeptide (TPR) repeat protein